MVLIIGPAAADIEASLLSKCEITVEEMLKTNMDTQPEVMYVVTADVLERHSKKNK